MSDDVMTQRIRDLVRAIDAGKITGGHDHDVIGVGISRFWIVLREARNRGLVVFKGHHGKREPWKVQRRIKGLSR